MSHCTELCDAQKNVTHKVEVVLEVLGDAPTSNRVGSQTGEEIHHVLSLYVNLHELERLFRDNRIGREAQGHPDQSNFVSPTESLRR